MADPMIRLEEVTKTFDGGRPAVDRLTLDVPAERILVLVGPSGCGKTTTLRMINRLVEPTSGRILVGGTDVRAQDPTALRRGIGYVIQQVGLFPHRTIAENIATVPRLLGWERERTARRVDELIELMGLDPAMKARYPPELSGGQRQRVGVARALAADPPVLLMDEPFGAVDPIVRGRLQDELLELQGRLTKTIVFVTHDIDEAIKLGDRIAILDVGGVLEQVGSPEEILRAPASDFVEAFLGGERGLKRLGLRRVADLGALPEGAVVDADAPADQAAGRARTHGVDWIGVREGDRLHGWAWVDDLPAGGTAGAATIRPFRVVVRPASTLRQALDALVSNRTGVAVVVDDDGRYLGMITLERLNAEITA